MGGNPHNPGGRGLGEIPRAELEGRVLAAEGRAAEMLVAFRDLSERLRAEREARVAAERERDVLARILWAKRERVATLKAALREFVDEAVNGDHFCGGVPSDWTDRFRAALGEQTDE